MLDADDALRELRSVLTTRELSSLKHGLCRCRIRLRGRPQKPYAPERRSARWPRRAAEILNSASKVVTGRPGSARRWRGVRKGCRTPGRTRCQSTAWKGASSGSQSVHDRRHRSAWHCSRRRWKTVMLCLPLDLHSRTSSSILSRVVLIVHIDSDASRIGLRYPST